jgi:RNA polymerase sigma-70 factor (ECF subfamily)
MGRCVRRGRNPRPAPSNRADRERSLAQSDLDSDILDGFRRGDPTAQRRVFERYGDRVYSIALRYLRGDEAAARDAAQEAFVRMFRSAATFRSESRLSTWLYRIVANTCIDELRRRRRLVLLGDIPESLHPVAPAPESDEADADVTAAVSRLSPKLRLAVLLRYFEDLSYDEMAEVLGCSPGTVASRLSRAHAALARLLVHLRHPAGGESTEVPDA